MGQVTTPNINVTPTINVPTTTSSKTVGAGYMGEFSTGLWEVFQQDVEQDSWRGLHG